MLVQINLFGGERVLLNPTDAANEYIVALIVPPFFFLNLFFFFVLVPPFSCLNSIDFIEQPLLRHRLDDSLGSFHKATKASPRSEAEHASCHPLHFF